MSRTVHRANLRQTLIDLCVMTLLGLILAVFGPFGTFAVPFAWRLVYWVGLAIVGYLCYRPVVEAVLHLGRSLELPEPACWIGSCLVATLPMTAVVWIVGHLPGRLAWPSLEQAVEMYAYVLVIGATLTTLFYMLDSRKKAASAPSALPAPITPSLPPEPDAAAPQAAVRFLDRIPPRLGTDLLALEMEDHYLRVHTALGSDLILLRMRDAAAELDGLDGAQVHRSWWVARRAVSGTRRDGRNLRLVLSSGQEVPVARDAAPALKAAGWF